MFICQRSHVVSEPREKPVRLVTSQREVTYVDVTETGEHHTTHGHEIVQELNVRLAVVDPERATRVAKQPISPRHYASLAEGRFEHARKCKKSPDECSHCQDNIRWFGSLPLGVLAVVLH